MKKVCILGVGRQGSAAAYDILLFAKPKELLLLDVNSISIENCLKKIKKVIPNNTVVKTEIIDLDDEHVLLDLLKPIDIMLSSVPYKYNPALTLLCIKSSTSMVDLGGHTNNVIKQLSYSDQAKDKGITIVPDCGMGPGMNISMALLAMEKLDNPKDVYIWDGGLPSKPQLPWNYSLFFNIAGLTNEYDGKATFLRNGKITEVECFDDFEKIEFENLGFLEAVVTSGGLSTMPWTYEGKLNTLENKTLRYNGHWDEMKSYRQLGLFDEDQIDFKGGRFSPREFYHHLLEPRLGSEDRNDICLMRTEAFGTIDDQSKGVRCEVVEKYDNDTDFMAMEKWTGWHASIVMQKIMDGSINVGAHSIEKALSGSMFYNEAVKRGYNIKTTLIEPQK